MTEEIKDEIIDESENADESTAENAGKKTSETQKTFTQDELNKIVRDRVAREKKDASKLSESWETERTELTATITSYEGIIKQMIDTRLVDVPDEYKDLVSKLSLSEQWEFISKQDKKLAPKKTIPVTPNANTEKEGDNKTPPPQKRFF